MYRYAALLFAMSTMPTWAQDEHPFIESFTLTVQEGRVLVQWVMKGGSTCDGSEVERSTDGETFSVVHRIEGLCGDPEVPVSFSWADAAPPELSTLFYRIQLGTEGRSSVKQVRFDQLTSSAQRFYPSPTSGETSLLLNIPASAQVELVIADAAGRVVLQRAGLVGRSHALDLRHLPAGAYTYVAEADGRRFAGRFVKE
ncbi:MAG: T9SS type A sorting domain-containing protein [Flavobacteriales bacterium]|nr:T9SS type A sorting domain-containing protein [Flavobacteriales bacterium]